MCGRFVITTPIEALREFLDAAGAPNVAANYNVAPTQSVPLLERDSATGARHLTTAHWGLIPSWAKDRGIASKMINARGESVADKPAYREGFRRRRCLVLADGYYEWTGPSGNKQPWYFAPKDGKPLIFAAISALWREPESGVTILSCSILTIRANADIEPIHHRMPVILCKDAIEDWLAGSVDAARNLIVPAPVGGLTINPVDRRVGRVQNNGPELITPVTLPSRDVPRRDVPTQGSLL